MFKCWHSVAGPGALAAVAALALAAAGCGTTSHARLWADTALPEGGLSLQPRQWAYDGEPVTFELEVDPGLANYVVFGIGGDETVVSIAKVEGRYRWTHVFHCGDRPQTFEVYAVQRCLDYCILLGVYSQAYLVPRA
jgi:hypothetical protein